MDDTNKIKQTYVVALSAQTKSRNECSHLRLCGAHVRKLLFLVCANTALELHIHVSFSDRPSPNKANCSSEQLRVDQATNCFFCRRKMRRNQSSQNTKRTCPDSLNQGVSSVMNHLMTTGHRTICSSGDTHIQQGRCESSGCRTSQKRTQSKPSGLHDTFLQDQGVGLGQEAHERSSLLRPAPAQLGICRLLFVPTNCKDSPVNVRCASVRGSRRNAGETSKLCPLPIAHHRKVAARRPQFPICVRRARSAPTC